MAEIVFSDSDFSNTPQTNKPKTDAPKADFAASLHGLNYNVDVLLQKLDPSVDLELRPKSEYRNTAAFKDLPEEQFNTWYKGVETAFNAFEQNKDMSLDNPFVKTLFDTPYTRALQTTNPHVKIGANIKQEFDFNPFAVTQGMAYKDQFHQERSVKEVAQRQTKVWDRKLGKFKELGSPVGNFFNFLDLNARGLIIATDKNGVPKVDNFGMPYYETMDGQVDPTGKDHLIAKAGDFFTEEGSFANRYLDLFDSDQIEANTTRILIKNAIKTGSMFVPGVGQVIAGVTALLNMTEMFAEGWKTFNAISNKLTTGEYKVDDDVNERANQLSTFAKSWSLNSTTEQEQQEPWSIASLSNMLADGVAQIRTQRFIAQAPIFGRALIDPKFRKALEAGDKSAQTYINASKNLARAYMTGQAAMEVGEAFEQAGLDKATKDLAMGAAALAFGALYKTAPFDWMLDGVGVNAVQKATKKVVEKEIKDLAASMAAESAKKALTEVEKKAILAKGLTAIQNKVKDFMANTNFAEAFKGSANEALEEGTEVIMGEALKKGFQFLGKNDLIKADKDALKRLDPFGENFLEDLALSAVAGGMSGGVFGAAQDLQLRKKARDINSLADISQSGYTEYALNELETLRNLGKKGKGLVSDKLSTEIERMENGMPIYKPMSDGTSLTSQNDYVINTVKQQLLSTHFALQGIGADKEGLEEKLKTANELFKSVYADAKNSSLLEDAKQISRELIATRAEIDELTKEAELKKANQTGDKSIDEELKVKLAPLQKKADALKERYEELAKVGKEKSELAEDYLRESLYKANPFAWAGFDIKSKSDFTEGKVGAELEQAEKDWEEYRLFKRNADVKKAYQEAKDIFNNSELFKKVKDPNTNLDNLIRNQQVEYLLSQLNAAQSQNNKEEAEKILSKLDAIFNDDTYTPTQDVLDMLKQNAEIEIPTVNAETIYSEEGIGSKITEGTAKLKLDGFDSDTYKKQIAEQLKDDPSLMIDKSLAFGQFSEADLDLMERSPEFGEYVQSLYTTLEGDPKEYPLGALSIMWDDPENREGYRDELEPLMIAKLNRIYDIVKGLRDNNVIKLDRVLSQKNKKLAENLAKKIKLTDVEQVINDNYELYQRDPKNYRDVNPKADSSITKQLQYRLKQVKKLKSTLQMPYQINPVVNRAKALNRDKFANPEPDFEFTDARQSFYLDNYLSNLQAQLEDLLDKLKQNQEGDIKIVRAGFLKGASKLAKNIIAANGLADDAVGFTNELREYTSLEDDDILKKESLDSDAKKLYEVLAKIGEALKPKNEKEVESSRQRTLSTKKKRSDVDVPDLKDYQESYVFFEEALRRGDYREFLDRLHGIKEVLNSGDNPVRIPTFEQEFAIFQAYSMVQAARDGKLEDFTDPNNTNAPLDFFNSIFIDGRPGIGKSDIIMRYLVELIKQDSGININITAKNDSVVEEVLAPKFGSENVKKLSDLGFDASRSVELIATNSHNKGYYHPALPHTRKEGLTNQQPVSRLKNVYLIDEATHLNTALVKQMSERDNAVFIFLGDTTQDGASETMSIGQNAEGKEQFVTEPFFQYTRGMERVPRITLSLRNSTENYDGNAAKLERLTKQLYQSAYGQLSDTFEKYKQAEQNQLNFVYTEDSNGTLVEGVKLSDDPVAETKKLLARLAKSDPEAKVAVVIDDGAQDAKYPPNVKILRSSTIQGQEFDYVIIDNIAFGDDALETTRKLNTLLSRYRKAMVLPSSIVNQYPVSTNKKEGAVSKLVVLTPEVLTELKEFSLNLTKDFSKSQVVSTTGSVPKQSVDKDGFAVFEENDEDSPEKSTGKQTEEEAAIKTYLYISLPNQPFSFTLANGKVLSTLSDKQQVINDIRDLSEDKFRQKYGSDVELKVEELNGQFVITLNKGDKSTVLFNLPDKKYLTGDPKVGPVLFNNLRVALNRARIFNKKNGQPSIENVKTVRADMEKRGMGMTLPLIINMSPLSIQDEIEEYFETDPYRGMPADQKKKVKERVMKDIIGWQGKAVVLQSSDPEIKENIDSLNARYDQDQFDTYSQYLIKKYIQHSIDYHAGIPERFNISVAFVKRGNQKTLAEYVKNVEAVSKGQADGLPRMSRSELRRFGTLVYNYMRSVVETQDNPMEDPLFKKLANWKHGEGLYIIHQGGRLEMDDQRQSALELLFGFGYENGGFYEAVPQQKTEGGIPVTKTVKRKGKDVEIPVLEYKRVPLKNKTDLPYKLKPYTRKVLNPYAEATEFQYDTTIIDTNETEIKQYSVLEALAGIDSSNKITLSNNIIETLSAENAKVGEKSKPLQELLNFTFSYKMEEAIPYYKVKNTNTLYALRAREDAGDNVNHNKGGRFPVVEVPIDAFNMLVGVSPRVAVSEIVKAGPATQQTPRVPPQEPPVPQEPPQEFVPPPSEKDLEFVPKDDEDFTGEPPRFDDVPPPGDEFAPHFGQDGDQQAPFDSFDAGNLTPRPPIENVDRWTLSPEMYNSILQVGYVKSKNSNKLKPNLAAFDKAQLAQLIYGTNGETLQRLGINFLMDEVLTPIYYYNYKTGEVLPDVYSKEGVERFNQNIQQLLASRKAAVQALTGVQDAKSEAFYIKLQELMLNIENDTDKQKIVAEYLTLQNLEHLLNFNVYSDISDILTADLSVDESGRVTKVFVPQNRIPDVTFNKESSDRGGTESSSAFTKNMLQRLPRLVLVNGKDTSGRKIKIPTVHSLRKTSYKEISKWLNELVYNSKGELLDAQGNVDAEKLREQYEKVLANKPINYDAEGIVNLYLLLFNEEFETTQDGSRKAIPFEHAGGGTIYSLSQALITAQQEAISTGNIEKAQTIQNVKTSINLFSKLKWLAVTSVDESLVVDQDSKAKMTTISEKYNTLNRKDVRAQGFEKALLQLYPLEAVEAIKNSTNSVIQTYATNEDKFKELTGSELSNFIQAVETLLESEKFKPVNSSVKNVNGDSINITGTRNISRDVENLARKTEENYENFTTRVC